MDHCQHPGKEPKGSCEDVPSSNDSGARIARFPSDHMSDGRLLHYNESQVASYGQQPILVTQEFSLPGAQPLELDHQTRVQGLKIFGLLPLLPELSFL